MHDILKEIVSSRIMRIETVKAGYTEKERLQIHKRARQQRRRLRQTFKQALVNKRSERAVIAEFKRASPSKGDINAGACPQAQSLKYEKNGACAISVLTEPDFFKGSLKDLRAVSQAVAIPILCKDFIVDPIQVDFAKISGADAILLIAGILDQSQLNQLYMYARSLDLDVLVEAHNQLELMKALKLKEAVIGINNRNLRTFETDIKVTERLMALIPRNRLVVSESGIKSSADMDRLVKRGAHAFLVGESLMTSQDQDFLRAFTGYDSKCRIKMCGLRRISDVRIANELHVDYVGFVFASSKRQVSVETAKSLIAELDPSIRSVGVFVDKAKEDVVRIAEICGLDIVQLHGQEVVENYDINRPVWKSIAVKADQPVHDPPHIPGASGLVYDTFHKNMAGGTGKSFLWEKALPDNQGYRISAGGLHEGNVKDCIETLRPDVVDISSGIESGAYKDPEKMRSFVKVVRSL